MGKGAAPDALLAPTRALTVIAQDPSVRTGGPRGPILRSALEVPAEALAPGPYGYRVQVIDYDASTDTLYAPLEYTPGEDPFLKAPDATLLGDPRFHAQNVYAIVMSTLARFEYALGRRIPWGFKAHQIKIAPHAFAGTNAYYSERDEALCFGYFPDRTGRRTVFSCLSHDVVAHETTHAIVDGLRPRYTDPSSPDQAAFHEGFADVVALLSVFAQRSVVDAILDADERAASRFSSRRAQIADGVLRRSGLFGLAEQMGQEMQLVRGNALRRSLNLAPQAVHLRNPDFLEPHRRGEILVAAMLDAFVAVWSERILTRGTHDGWSTRNRDVEAEEGADVADRLLTIAIRALDYVPAVDLRFGDYLTALLTADRELYRDDSRFHFRMHVPRSFADFGIVPASRPRSDGCWEAPTETFDQGRVRFDALQRDPDEVHRFVWENRERLSLYPGAHVRVCSVRPVVRQGRDGFTLRETVAEYVESLSLRADELSLVRTHPRRGSTRRARRPLKAPAGMAATHEVTLFGGGILVFDEFGRVKFHVKSRIDGDSQQERLDHLHRSGFFDPGKRSRVATPFAQLHLQRALAVRP